MPTVSVPPACTGGPTSNKGAPSTSAVIRQPIRYCHLHLRIRLLRLNGYRRQILEPALGLDKALHLGRQRTRVEIVHDKDHHRLAAFELVQLGQEGEPLL